MVLAGTKSRAEQQQQHQLGQQQGALDAVRRAPLKRRSLSKFYTSKARSFSSFEELLSGSLGHSTLALAKQHSCGLGVLNGGSGGCESGSCNSSGSTACLERPAALSLCSCGLQEDAPSVDMSCGSCSSSSVQLYGQFSVRYNRESGGFEGGAGLAPPWGVASAPLMMQPRSWRSSSGGSGGSILASQAVLPHSWTGSGSGSDTDELCCALRLTSLSVPASPLSSQVMVV